MEIGVTGPRVLSEIQAEVARRDLGRIMATGVKLHVGDAEGLDALALAVAVQCRPVVYVKNSKLPWKAQGAERSTRMVKALASAGGVLYAWPNKPAPKTLAPSRCWPRGADGSGTWGTIALAHGLGVAVELHPLIAMDLPSWLKTGQMALF